MDFKPTLRGTRVVLRPIEPDDAAAMHASLADGECQRLTGTTRSFTLDEVRRHCERVSRATDRVDYAITLADDPSYLGEAVLNEIDRDQRCASFRIALAGEALFGQGYGTEATRLLLEHGFDGLGLHRIELEVYDFNPRARHVYEKLGFVQEGVRRDVLLWEGTYHSAILMSLLEDEYRLSGQ